MQPMPTRRRWRLSHILLGLIIVAGVVYWVAQTIRKGAFSLDPTNAAAVVRSKPADGDRNVSVETTIIATLKPETSVNESSLSEGVHLYRASDRQPVPGRMMVNKQGDEITFAPFAPLAPGTKYTFEVDGLQDSAERDVIPYAASFTTKAAD
jgi:hypothetical protein